MIVAAAAVVALLLLLLLMWRWRCCRRRGPGARAFCSQGGGVGEREYQFLNSIRDALGMEQEKCDELVRDSKVHRVSVMVEQMFERGTIACEDVRKMRDTADQFEVSLTADLDVSVPRLEKMFTTELMHMVDEGELVSDDLGALEEVCESLHVSEERASALLDNTVTAAAAPAALAPPAAPGGAQSRPKCHLARLLFAPGEGAVLGGRAPGNGAAPSGRDRFNDG